MNDPRSLFALILVATLACGPEPSKQPSPPTIEAQVLQLVPNLTPRFEPDRTDLSGPYGIYPFNYGQAPEWPYGEGFAVTSKVSRTVLWVHLHHGDYPPHHVRWADFDGDHKLDIFFHAGFEDVATTHVYVNRIAQEGFGLTQFVQAYENDDVYSVVLDFGGDGRPELLEPEPYPDESDKCAQEFLRLEYGYAPAGREYHRLAGPFDRFNYRFGVPVEDYVDLSLFDRVRIRSVGGTPISPAVDEHLRWRLRSLREIRPRVSDSCRSRVDQTIVYLEESLKREPGTAI